MQEQSTAPSGRATEAAGADASIERRLAVRAARLGVEVDGLSDLDVCAVLHSTDAEGEEAWLAGEREADAETDRHLQRMATDDYRLRVERAAAVDRASHEQPMATRRVRVPPPEEWAERHPDDPDPSKTYRLFVSIAERQNAVERRSRPARVRKALRRVRTTLAPPRRLRRARRPLPARPRARRRPRGATRSSSRGGDSGDGDGDGPESPPRVRLSSVPNVSAGSPDARCSGCPEATR